MKYIMSFKAYTINELNNTTYISAASKLKELGHFQRAEDLLNHIGLSTKNKFDIFYVHTDSANGASIKVNIHYGDGRKITIFYDGEYCEVSGDKFTDRKNARRFLSELLKNDEFNQGILHYDMPELRNVLRVNDFYNEA